MSTTSKIPLLSLVFSIVFLAGEMDGKPYLDDLGSQIEAQVRRSLAPLDNLGERISAQVQASTAHLNNLGPQITSRVHSDLSHLDHLGEDIEKEVYEGLAPVRALEAAIKVKYGQNGHTIATFQPSRRKFLVRNGIKYVCPDEISETTGECSGKLERFKPAKNEDFCFIDNKLSINNQLCLNSGEYVNFNSFNEKVSCNSNDGSPTLLINAEQYKKMCQNIASSADYKYFPNTDEQLPNDNIKCSVGPPKICTYSETNRFSGNYGSNVIVSGGSVTIQN